MPQTKIDHIVSFSSEDSVHTANNILSTDTSKKWKCKSAGEKQAIVVLQLEKASQITAIDIGNEHSAYIEVLVSRSSSNDDFKVLLVTSAFMTPLEARQSQNVNKVRMFTQEQLSKPECEEKWDRVKIVCTQPFNKHVQFGLSFITLHSNESKITGTPGSTKIGNFLIRPASPDSLSAGNLFAKRKEFKQDAKCTTAAAAIRDAASSSPTLHSSPACKPKLLNKGNHLTPKKTLDNEEPVKKNRNRDELFYTEDDNEKNEKIDRIMKKKEEEDRLKQEAKDKMEQKRKKLFDSGDTVKNKKKKHDEDDENPVPPKRPNLFNLQDKDKKKESPQKTPKKIKNDNDSNEFKKNNKENKKRKLSKPFNKLLDDVVLVISGIQNPDRANLRSMAMSMGAKYKTDWDSSCTHLICAFPNTPKFNQVKGKGKIVKKSWIESCHSQRKRLPWRKYALDKSDAEQSDDEEEIEELLDTPSTSRNSTYQCLDISDDEHKAEGSDTEEKLARIMKEKRKEKKESSITEGSDTEEKLARIMKEKRKEKKECSQAEGSDTEEKLARIMKKKRKEKKESSMAEGSDTEEKLARIMKKQKRESIKKRSVSNSNDDLEIKTTPGFNSETGNITKTNDIYEADTDEEHELQIYFNNRPINICPDKKLCMDSTTDEET